MRSIQLFGLYVLWHYTRAFADLFRGYRNVLWFFYNFFSIPTLVLTLFAPFERLHESYGRGLDVERFFTALIANTLMRVVGAVVRLFVIVIGVAVLLAALVGGLLFFALWIVLPAVAVSCVIYGIALLLMPI